MTFYAGEAPFARRGGWRGDILPGALVWWTGAKRLGVVTEVHHGDQGTRLVVESPWSFAPAEWRGAWRASGLWYDFELIEDVK